MRIVGMVRSVLLTGSAMAILAGLQIAEAQSEQPVDYGQPRQPLADALRQVGATSGWEIFFAPGDVRGRTAPALVGRFDVREAVDLLLRGTDDPQSCSVPGPDS